MGKPDRTAGLGHIRGPLESHLREAEGEPIYQVSNKSPEATVAVADCARKAPKGVRSADCKLTADIKEEEEAAG